MIQRGFSTVDEFAWQERSRSCSAGRPGAAGRWNCTRGRFSSRKICARIRISSISPESDPGKQPDFLFPSRGGVPGTVHFPASALAHAGGKDDLQGQVAADTERGRQDQGRSIC